jgi:UDP-N-acetylmuramate: L-alanyl-gamma-D-glutamyl-meso-diaminopimelate ligase
MKLGVMKQALPASLVDADLVFCFGASLGWDASEALAPMGNKASVFENMDTLIAAIVTEAKDGDQVLVMSNGGFGGIHQKLLTQLATKKSA